MQDKYEIMEQRDEAQILAEAKGNIIKEMFYKFKVGGQEVTGISWVGTKEIARRYGGIKMGLPKVDDLGEYYAASVAATDTKNDLTLVGTSMQPKNMQLRDGSEKIDPFAYTKAVSKAQRNAIRALIPETFLLQMEREFSSKKPVKKQEPRKESAQVTVAPPGDLSVDSIKGYLEQCGYDSNKFTIRHDKEARMYVIDKAPWIEDWNQYQSDIRELGGEYNQEYKKSVVRY